MQEVGLEGGLNPYAYALNSPVMYVDMTGESPILVAMGGGAGIGGGLYIGKTGIKAYFDARKNNQSLISGTWNNFANTFSFTEFGQQAVVGAAFGGIGKAAFLAADVHIAKTVLPASASTGQKIASLASNTATNKVREFTTPAGVVITGNMLTGKTSTNLMLNSNNSQQSMQQLNQQLNQQMLNQQFIQYQQSTQFVRELCCLAPIVITATPDVNITREVQQNMNRLIMQNSY
ncbi:hypothetical protein [Acinetobacter populi]|uniref:hypothetical protein n=1 Tax=Acinetobacter populi TaxID=1582270 RepID=UPI001BC89998|nr:hypothetical protein [Acinetobacter populi]